MGVLLAVDAHSAVALVRKAADGGRRGRRRRCIGTGFPSFLMASQLKDPAPGMFFLSGPVNRSAGGMCNERWGSPAAQLPPSRGAYFRTSMRPNRPATACTADRASSRLVAHQVVLRAAESLLDLFGEAAGGDDPVARPEGLAGFRRRRHPCGEHVG